MKHANGRNPVVKSVDMHSSHRDIRGCGGFDYLPAKVVPSCGGCYFQNLCFVESLIIRAVEKLPKGVNIHLSTYAKINGIGIARQVGEDAKTEGRTVLVVNAHWNIAAKDGFIPIGEIFLTQPIRIIKERAKSRESHARPSMPVG